MVPEIPSTSKKINTVVVWIIVVVVLAFVAMFLWRVLYYYQQIQSGNLNPHGLAATGITVSERIESLPAVPDGEFDVVSSDDPCACKTICRFAHSPFCQKMDE